MSRRPRPWSFEKASDEIDALARLTESLVRSDQGVVVAHALEEGWPAHYVSPGFERLSGYSASEILAGRYPTLYGPANDDQGPALIRQALEQQLHCRWEFLQLRKDGSSYLNEVTIFPVRDAEGQQSRFVSIHTDVSHHRGHEEQLRHAQRMEAAGLLAAGVAHDFNSLLTVINGYSDILLAGLPEGSPQREMLMEIRGAGERSAALIRQLLAFSRRQVVAPRPFELNALVRRLEPVLGAMTGSSIGLRCCLQPSLPSVMADPAQIEQALLNLVGNACDAMAGGGSLEIVTEMTEGGWVALSVADTGCGIPVELRPRLFEPFFTTKKAGRAAGLGLAAVYGIVNQSGGRITVQSEQDRGSTFRLVLPAGSGPLKKEKARGRASRDHEGQVILVADDEDGLLNLVRRVLTRHGFTVFAVPDGGSALRFLDEHEGRIHLLLTDVVMPGASGPQVAECALARDSQTRVLYMSGYTDDAVVKRGVSRDEVHFLPKPFTPAILLEKVREVLDD